MQKQIQKKFEYVIKIDGKIVWRGLNPKEIYWDFKKANPHKEVGIAWVTHDERLLIC